MSNKNPAKDEILGMTVPELRQLAHKEKINLEGRDKKSDIQESVLGHFGYNQADDAAADASDETAAEEVTVELDSETAEAMDLEAGTYKAIRTLSDETVPGVYKYEVLNAEGEIAGVFDGVSGDFPPVAGIPATAVEAAPEQKKDDKPAKADKIDKKEKPAAGTASEEDEKSLKGSKRQPEEIDLADGTKVAIGDVVAEAFSRTGLKVKQWNALPDGSREAQISEVVKELATKGAGIIKKTNGKPKTVAEALKALLGHEQTVRNALRAHPAAVRAWNDSVNDAKAALENA